MSYRIQFLLEDGSEGEISLNSYKESDALALAGEILPFRKNVKSPVLALVILSREELTQA